MCTFEARLCNIPSPRIDADVVDEDGKPCPPGVRGYLVIKRPWPGMLMTLYKDPERYKKTYWSRFPGVYFAADYAIKDDEGYFWLLGRADEVLKIAGHRIGTAEVESAVVEHPAVAEAAVVGKPDPVKGETILVFVILKKGYEASEQFVKEIKEHIHKTIGPVVTPEAIYFVHSLPKTRSGKIMRRVIKAVALNTNIGDLTTLEDEASVEDIRKAYEEFRKVVEG